MGLFGYLVCLVCLVGLVDLGQPNKPNKPDLTSLGHNALLGLFENAPASPPYLHCFRQADRNEPNFKPESHGFSVMLPYRLLQTPS